MVLSFFAGIYSGTDKAEKISGTVTGSIGGVTAYVGFSDILLTLMIALFTGILGAAGADLYKHLKEKYKRKYGK